MADSTDMQKVSLRIGKDKHFWEFPTPVLGEHIFRRLESELNLGRDDVKNVLHKGKKVKGDTVVTKTLTVNLAKKKKNKKQSQAPAKPKKIAESVSWNFDFGSVWRNLSSLALYFSPTEPAPSAPANMNQQKQCEVTLHQTSKALQSLSEALASNAQSISSDPSKHEELCAKMSELGQTLTTLGAGISGKSALVEPIVIAKEQTDDIVDDFDDLVNDLVDSVSPLPTTVIEKRSPQQQQGPDLMSLMGSLMGGQNSNTGNGQQKPNLMSMLFNNKKDEVPKSKGPTAWMDEFRGSRSDLKKWTTIITNDTRAMKSMSFGLSRNYLNGSTRKIAIVENNI